MRAAVVDQAFSLELFQIFSSSVEEDVAMPGMSTDLETDQAKVEEEELQHQIEGKIWQKSAPQHSVDYLASFPELNLYSGCN